MTLELIHAYPLPGTLFAVAAAIASEQAEWHIKDSRMDAWTRLTLVRLPAYADTFFLAADVTLFSERARADVAGAVIVEQPETGRAAASLRLETDQAAWIPVTEVLRGLVRVDAGEISPYMDIGQAAIRSWWWQRLPEWAAQLDQAATPAASGLVPKPAGRPGGENAERDREIRAHFTGAREPRMSRRQLAEAYNLSYDRIKQIVKGARKQGVEKGDR